MLMDQWKVFTKEKDSCWYYYCNHKARRKGRWDTVSACSWSQSGWNSLQGWKLSNLLTAAFPALLCASQQWEPILPQQQNENNGCVHILSHWTCPGFPSHANCCSRHSLQIQAERPLTSHLAMCVWTRISLDSSCLISKMKMITTFLTMLKT